MEMTQDEFESLFISKNAICARLNKSCNYLDHHIEHKTFPKALELKSGRNKVFKLYYREDIRHHALVKGVV
jgi:predicted DNA-binding transcriptional regulator AlpA